MMADDDRNYIPASDHIAFVSKAIARRRWQSEHRWKELVLTAEEFLAAHAAAHAAVGTGYYSQPSAYPTPVITPTEMRDRIASISTGYSDPPTVTITTEMRDCLAWTIAVWTRGMSPTAWETATPTEKQPYQRAALEVLKTMREPTEAMAKRGDEAARAEGAHDCEVEMSDVYRAMIDTALGE